MGKNQSWKTDRDGLDKLTLEEGEVPSPGDGEVLVKILAVSLNYRDTEGPGHLITSSCDRGKRKS